MRGFVASVRVDFFVVILLCMLWVRTALSFRWQLLTMSSGEFDYAHGRRDGLGNHAANNLLAFTYA